MKYFRCRSIIHVTFLLAWAAARVPSQAPADAADKPQILTDKKLRELLSDVSIRGRHLSPVALSSFVAEHALLAKHSKEMLAVTPDRDIIHAIETIFEDADLDFVTATDKVLPGFHFAKLPELAAFASVARKHEFSIDGKTLIAVGNLDGIDAFRGGVSAADSVVAMRTGIAGYFEAKKQIVSKARLDQNDVFDYDWHIVLRRDAGYVPVRLSGASEAAGAIVDVTITDNFGGKALSLKHLPKNSGGDVAFVAPAFKNELMLSVYSGTSTISARALEVNCGSVFGLSVPQVIDTARVKLRFSTTPRRAEALFDGKPHDPIELGKWFIVLEDHDRFTLVVKATGCIDWTSSFDTDKFTENLLDLGNIVLIPMNGTVIRTSSSPPTARVTIERMEATPAGDAAQLTTVFTGASGEQVPIEQNKMGTLRVSFALDGYETALKEIVPVANDYSPVHADLNASHPKPPAGDK